MNIFIVDDSAVIRKRLHLMLGDIPGVRLIGHAGTAANALKGIHDKKPDVVILDVRLPDGSGIDVLRSIKASGKGGNDESSMGTSSDHETPVQYHVVGKPLVIVLTNFPFSRCRDVCLEEGADYFFDKSAEFERVVDIIQERAEAGFER